MRELIKRHLLTVARIKFVVVVESQRLRHATALLRTTTKFSLVIKDSAFVSKHCCFNNNKSIDLNKFLIVFLMSNLA